MVYCLRMVYCLMVYCLRWNGTAWCTASTCLCRHSTIAEAWAAVGVLTDDPVRYRKAINLYHATVRDYFKWGRARRFKAGRIVGETSETLRDIYHTQVME